MGAAISIRPDGQEVYLSNRKPSKAPLSSSGMDIPDYAIHQLALCLLPLMRQHFEAEEIKRAEGRSITTDPAQMPVQQANSAL